MAKAKRAHRTPRTDSSAISDAKIQPFRDLEPRVCDLVRFCEIANDLCFNLTGNPGDEKSRAHAMLISEIVLERPKALKADYYTAYRGER
jgi:hypothetical protein